MNSCPGFISPSISISPTCSSADSDAYVHAHAETRHYSRNQLFRKNPSYVIIMRHGLTDWNLAGRVQGGLDASRLSSEGMEQAKMAGKFLQHVSIDSVFCSPLTRAKDTTDIAIANSMNPMLASLQCQVLPSLCEIKVPWQGLLKSEISTSFYAKEYARYLRNPRWFSYNGFSPFRDIASRANHVWDTVGRTNSSCSLLVGHNQMNKALICSKLGMQFSLSSWRQNNCCFNVFRIEEGKAPQLRLCNSTELGFVSRKPQPKFGFVRVVLHRKGGSAGLNSVKQDHDIAHYFLIGDTKGEDVGGKDDVESEKISRLGWSEAASSVGENFRIAVGLLEELREKHKDQCIVLSVDKAERICCLIAACVGLGVNGVDRFYSDAGGVSIVDLNSSARVGSVTSFVACHNVGAWPSMGPLLGYTRNNGF